MGIGGTRLLVARTSTEPGAPWGLHWIHAYRNHKPFDETQGPVILPEECDDMLLMEGLNRADGGESVILVCRDRIIRGYPNPERQDQSWLFDSQSLATSITLFGGPRNCVAAFLVSTIEISICSSPLSLTAVSLLRAYRFVTEDEGPPIPTPLNTLHPLLAQLGSDDLIHPIYLNRDANAPLVRIVDERLVEYAQFSEDENNSSSLWKQMKVSAEVERAIYSQLAQQIVVVGQPDGQGERSVFVVSTATTEGKFNLWACFELRHHSAHEYPFLRNQSGILHI